MFFRKNILVSAPAIIALFAFFSYQIMQIYNQIPMDAPLSIKFKSYRKKILTHYGFIELQRKETKKSQSPHPTPEYDFYVANMSYYDEIHGMQSDVPLNVYMPKTQYIEGVVLYFHGSGFCTSHPNGYHSIVLEKFAMKKYVVVAMDYRKGPEYKQSYGLRDSEEGLKWILENIVLKNPVKDKLNEDAMFLVMGDSAGGAIAIHLARVLRNNDYKIEGEGHILFGKEKTLIVPLYPWICFQGQEYCPVKWEKKLEKRGMVCDGRRLDDFTRLSIDDDPRFLKIYNFYEDLDDLPLHYVFTGELDVLALEGNYFGELLRKISDLHKIMEIEGEIHGFGIRKKESWETVIQETLDTISFMKKSNQRSRK